MKALIWTIIGLILILLVSYIAISQEPNSFVIKTFVIEGDKENVETGYNNLNTFMIEQKPTGRTMLININRETKNARERNIMYEQRDEEIEKCINKITKNWKTTISRKSYEKVYDENGELITTNVFYETERSFYGYDEGEFRLRWRLRNKALNGEKIC